MFLMEYKSSLEKGEPQAKNGNFKQCNFKNSPKALLDAKVSPLLLRHAVRLGHKFGKGLASVIVRFILINRNPNLWQHNMPVFVLVIFVLVRIVDLL